MTRKVRVGVLFGGQSGEHEVSLVSARAVMDGLDPERYDVTPIGITKHGRWIIAPDAHTRLLAQADPAKLPGGSSAGAADAADGVDDVETTDPLTLMVAGEQSPLKTLDVVFPVLHGPMGEDGTVQGLLELMEIPYVGCGVMASAVGMDKAMTKVAFSGAGLPVLPWLLIRRREWEREPAHVLDWVEQRLTYPMFVKPANLGSSVGISKVTGRAALARGIAEAAAYDRRIVVEQGIPAREIEVSILGNNEPEASVPGEVVPSGEWYDYEAKYLSGASKILIPAPITLELAARVRRLAVQAFKAIDGAGLARVDFLLNRETGDLYLNEINTMPGFTPVSMYAMMWEASGLPYTQLLDRLIELALERRGRGRYA
ncbi:D-alanine--D-alanine ligase family protein [Roseiflexus castenholzii]|jgi:D-alanine-D-alanine ligase|uniref:D-alanine--D-alanine ligase n=1 Tax=Roseiflexus castenholzii (strain DSM 13941 / HLO8) TaxID=383372 RepID=A7NI89_ROSCS|nr:D-alanine--D-alanine ligase family protein [Roseiflexus castenholzii]ABU57189.1 D-alanine--D-alanine ligase [Roseiflexus castenholzii DSM 13941]